MIDVPLNKLLFFDLETVGIEKDYTTLNNKNPEMGRLFESYRNWFEKRYPEDVDKSLDEIFTNHAALISDFAKIIVASFSFITPSGEVHTTTFAEDDEKKLFSNSFFIGENEHQTLKTYKQLLCNFDTNVQLKKNQIGVPFLYQKGKKLPVSISTSHHGNYGAFAFSHL